MFLTSSFSQIFDSGRRSKRSSRNLVILTQTPHMMLPALAGGAMLEGNTQGAKLHLWPWGHPPLWQPLRMLSLLCWVDQKAVHLEVRCCPWPMGIVARKPPRVQHLRHRWRHWWDWFPPRPKPSRRPKPRPRRKPIPVMQLQRRQQKPESNFALGQFRFHCFF